jgi:hypothetical protein
MTTQVMGEEGFRWFLGIVEDINDPKQLGRVKVRVFHEDDTDVTTEDLDWAQVMTPVTSAGTDGIGETPALQKGSRVVGFFIDGQEKQMPLIIGSIPTIPSEARHAINKLARGQQVLRKNKVDASEPDSPYKAEYPYNKVIATEAGHAIELDDTPNNERVHIYHKSGAYIEINSKGQMVIKSPDDSYDIVGNNKNIYIKGDCNVQVQGNMNAVVKGNLTSAAEGNVTISAKGILSLFGKGGIRLRSGGSITMAAPGGVAVTQGGLTTLGSISSGTGVTGSFTTPSGKTVHVSKGMVSNIY